MNAIRRFSIVLAVGIACLPAATRAEGVAPPPGSAARANDPESLNGFAPRRSGRVAGPALHRDRAATPAVAIPVARPELSVTAAVAATVDPESVGPVNARLLDRDITQTFASLHHCRSDLGWRKRASPALIAADTLTLRWTIARKGQVGVMDAVGSTPLYPGVLDCITRETNGWLFALPAGGDARLNRALVFRRLSPAVPRP